MAGEILAAAEALITLPRRGRAVASTALRETPLPYPYIIRYRVDESASTVVILRVRHGSRGLE